MEEKIPDKFDLSKIYEFSIFDQGSTMMCVATAVLTAIEYINQLKGNPFKSYSRLYTYFYGRVEYGHPKELRGLKLESAILSLEDYGMVQNQILSDNLDHLNSDIDEDIIQKTKHPTNIVYYELEINSELFKRKLLLHFPIICILRCTLSELSFKKRIIKHKEKEGKKFSHCVCIVGYDDDEEVFLFQNSQGISWQFDGFGKIAYNGTNKIVKAITIENFNI